MFGIWIANMDTASEPEVTTPNDPNRHVLNYLEYYCKPDNSFDFAVLLKGSWGTGKTFLIKHFLEERPKTLPHAKRKRGSRLRPTAQATYRRT